MKNKIRYSRLPKCAYGTKLPKYAYGYNEDTHQFDKTNGGADMVGGAAESYLNSTPYYAAASAASGIGKSLVKKKQTVDPNTGEVTEGYATNEGYMADGAMTAHHTTMLNDAKKGDYAAAVMHSNGITGTIYDFANAKNVRSDFRKKEAENEAAQATIDAEEAKRKQDFENKQRDIYSRAYIASNPEMGREGASVYAFGTEEPDKVKIQKGTEMTFATPNKKYKREWDFSNPSFKTLKYKDENGNTVGKLDYNYDNSNVIPKLAMGGDINQIASNMGKAEGATHEQGGITLDNENGEPAAEVEDQEMIIDDSKVLSDRLPFTGKVSFAQKGEQLAKLKSKYEGNLKSGDRISKNTSTRNIEKIDNEVNTLLKYQDIVRKNLGLDGAAPVNKYKWGTDFDGNPVWEDDKPTDKELYGEPSNMQMRGLSDPEVGGLKGDTSLKTVPQYEGSNISKSGRSSSNDYLNMAQNAAPYLDNAINYALIKQTPKIPKPIKNIAIDEMAMPLNTSYNINPTLIANNQDLKEFNKNILDNTSSSNNARAGMASGFAKKLRMNNDVYGQKENIENQLKDKNALNLQSVNNRNVNNRQNIDNANIAQDNKYNWDNMLRDDSIRAQKSKLGAETTADITTGIQDDRMSKLDDKKILYDSLKYGDGAGLATMVDSPEIATISKTKESRDKIRETFRKSGQKAALEKYNKKYGLD